MFIGNDVYNNSYRAHQARKTPAVPRALLEKLVVRQVEDFGQKQLMGRAGQPWEVATAYLFLASSDGNYYTGQCLHPNGGAIVGA